MKEKNQEPDQTEADASTTNIGELEQKTCKDKTCRHGGKPQPIGNFTRHATSGKWFKNCRECVTRRRLKGSQKKTVKARPADPATLTINFTDHPEILDKIRQAAKALMREPEVQVLYWLTKAEFDKLGTLG